MNGIPNTMSITKCTLISNHIIIYPFQIHEALRTKGILDDSVIVFTTDNGGPANGFDYNWANNYPLRGVKASLFEGNQKLFIFISINLKHDIILITSP